MQNESILFALREVQTKKKQLKIITCASSACKSIYSPNLYPHEIRKCVVRLTPIRTMESNGFKNLQIHFTKIV